MKSARPPALFLAVLFLIGFGIGSTASAQNKPETPPAVEPDKRTSSNDELLKELVPDILPGGDDSGTTGNPSGLDELDRTVKAMREVGAKLDKGDTSSETRDLQAAILDDIDALIEKLKNPPPQQQPDPKPQDGSPKPQPNQGSSGQKPQPETTPQEQKPQTGSQQTGSGSGQSSQRQQNSQAGDSTEDARQQAQARATALARRRALINEFWGHLRPSVREKLLNVGSEKMLPHYEELIRRYYESLTDPGVSRN